MIIRRRHADDPKSSDITPEQVYRNRRQVLIGAGSIAAGTMLSGLPLPALAAEKTAELDGVVKTHFTVSDRKVTDWTDATEYNNFYEFGTDKVDPYTRADTFKPQPWSVVVEGACAKPGRIAYEDLIKPHTLEERVYRFRCVEAWSMVVPWVGIPLGEVLKRFEPNSDAKYVAFETLYDPEQMPGQRRAFLEWPYREGLRMDEAMNDLTLLTVGMYGRVLPNQNGAPLRLIVPWKYGFKSIKSIVKIRFQKTMPPTTWNMMQPREYGFYSNVNPSVDHPRWSQAKERVLGAGFFAPKIDTLMFNGYGEQVASLYSGMDLRKNY